MTELRKRMIECLQLRGLSARTQESYVRAVRQLAEHYHKSPDLITEEELRQYFLYLKNVKHYARNTSTIAICGIRFFFERTLEKQWTIFNLVRPAPEKKLPVILSVAEVRQILGRIRLPRYKVCLTTIYSCGLRLQEGTHLQVADIDSARLMSTPQRSRPMNLQLPTTVLFRFLPSHRGARLSPSPSNSVRAYQNSLPNHKKTSRNDWLPLLHLGESSLPALFLPPPSLHLIFSCPTIILSPTPRLCQVADSNSKYPVIPKTA
jgi:integrase